MKKLAAILLCLALVLSLASCGKETPEATTIPEDGAQNQVYTEPSSEDTEASVIFLNHDAGTDEVWRSLAETYEGEFDVSVKVLTAVESYYAETLAEQLEKDEYPTLFYAKDAESLKDLGDTCLDLSGTELQSLAGQQALANAIPVPTWEEGNLVWSGNAGYWCINAKASQLDIDATVAFLTWALSSQTEALFPQN